MKNIVLYSLVFLSTSCWSPYIVDLDEKLPKGYFYRGNKSPYISCGNFYDNKDIYPIVMKYKYDERFIIVKQKPKLFYYQSRISERIRRLDSIQNYDNIYSAYAIYDKKADSILKYDPQYRNLFNGEYYYWIIDVNLNLHIGPMSKQNYELKFKEMKIPEKLKV